MPNISSSKDNHTMKLDQLKEYNMINIFHEKHIQNVVGKQVPGHFLKNENFLQFVSSYYQVEEC